MKNKLIFLSIIALLSISLCTNNLKASATQYTKLNKIFKQDNVKDLIGFIKKIQLFLGQNQDI